MAFGTVVHHFAVGIVLPARPAAILGRTGGIGRVGPTVGDIGDFGPHFLVIGFDGPRAGHVAQAPVKALIGSGHVI